MNIFSSIETHARQYPDHNAVVYAGKHISYQRFVQNVNALAMGMQGLGLKSGDRIALFMPNRPQLICAFYAAMKLGLVNVSLNTMLQKDELDYILGDCQPHVLIAHHSLIPVVKTLHRAELGQLRVIQVGGETSNLSGSISFDALIAGHAGSACETLDLDAGTDAVIAYTSGTTGFPKGAVHSHGAIVYHLDAMARHLRLGPTDTFLAALPFFQLPSFLIHAGMALHVGATLVVMEKFERQAFLDWIKKEHVTFFAGVPTIYQMLFDAAREQEAAFGGVRFGICAGAPLSIKLRTNFERRLRLRIVHCYGSTETPLIAAFERPDEEPQGISVGCVAPHVRLRLVQSDGTPAPMGAPGEIQLGAETSLKYYWNKPAATAELIRDGWFSTGDIGRLDEYGHLHIVDRSKDMIIRGGFNIYPAEIERVLLQAPEIREAVVVGVPHARLGEVPKAYVVVVKGACITEADVIALSREKLAAFKALEAVEFVDQDFFPRSAMGKILKNKIKRGKNEN